MNFRIRIVSDSPNRLASYLKPHLRRCLAATSVPPLSWAYRALYRLLIRHASRGSPPFLAPGPYA